MKNIGKWLNNFLLRFFLPHEGNEYKPHVLREIWVLVFLFIALATFAGGLLHRDVITKSNYLAAIYSSTLVNLANQDRELNSIGGLAVNPILERAAQMKARDMAVKGYFAHYSPDGLAPWDWIKLAGYSYVYAGENLAINFTDSTDINNAWMKSPSHRANLLNERYTEIGIATEKGTYQGRETTFVVEMFGSPAVAASIDPTLPDIVAVLPNPTPERTVSTSSSVMGAESEDVSATSKNLENKPQESFMSTENKEATPATLAPTIAGVGEKKESKFKAWKNLVMSNPKYLLNVIYVFLAIIISIGLFGFTTIELEKHHYKHVAYGFLMLVIIFSLGYIYKTAIFSKAVVAGIGL
ncbi:MAG TPA: CAP domain-containing protein [Candidatus Paceibacterota bacterium]